MHPKVDKIPSRANRLVNDTLYSTIRPNLRHYGIIKHPIRNMVASTGFVQLSSKVDWVGHGFIYIFLTPSWITSRLQTVVASAVSAYPSIFPQLRDWLLPMLMNGQVMVKR